MSDQEWSEPPGPHPPPAALPDGSIPLYGSYPPPGAPGGEAAQPPVPLSKQANVQAYYSNLVACLTKAWAPQVQAAKDTFTPPRLIFWSGVVQSPCAGPAARQLQYDAPDQDSRLELSRRLELQACCLSAVSAGANKSSYGINGLNLTIYQNYVQAQTGDENNRGGPRDHGARASHLYWTGRGFTTLDSVSCNTFTATAGKVF